jgi:hypothetical protein
MEAARMNPIVRRKYLSCSITPESLEEYSWLAFCTKKMTTTKTRLMMLSIRFSDDPKNPLDGF